MDILEKFNSLLKELFQFEASDLDFGIYRILNFKREQIKKFIERDLVDQVESAFAKHRNEKLANVDQEYNRIKQKIIKNFGKDAITPTGELKEEFKNTPLGIEFQEKKAQKEEVAAIDEIKTQVFNDLYCFFSRYYEDGDFVPKYRYSLKGHRYTIPYNGEEIKLYWVNLDQYYTKTGVLFRDYTFKTNDYIVIFRVVEAKEELGSNKATKERFFVLDDEEPLKIENKSLIIRFQYRELTEKEVKDYEVEGGSNLAKQEKINQGSYKELLKIIEASTLKANLSKEYINEKPLLLYQISRFTAKNTKDYFIHKNLRRFLSEQLEYFIKAEILNIETIEKERFLEKHITRAKVVREIGETLIDFLAQLEDFQKIIWEKKKFVIETQYVITLDKIKEYASKEFLEQVVGEVLKNKKQLDEWKKLEFGEIKTKEDLIETGNPKNKALFDDQIKKLPVDTRYFSQEFKERLLENLSKNNDLENILDGLLIKSENWQALNLLLEKYKERVQTVFIDPPFNKEQDADYLYNVKYKDSTWASMLENRLRLARELLNSKGSIFVRCDYNGNWIVRPLMNDIFGKENFKNEIVINRTQEFFKYAQGLNKFLVDVDSLLFFVKTSKALFIEIRIRREDEKWWEPFLPGESRNEEDKYRIVIGKKIKAPSGRKWGLKQEQIYELEKEGRIKIENDRVLYAPLWTTLKNNWTDIPGYSRSWGFLTENTEILLKRVIESTSNEGDLVMDFFLGSGTTTAVAQKLKRKWIGIEMGEHFWNIILPRMKRVLFYDPSQISKEKDVKEKYNEKTAGGFFKYQILEQYEDTLDNIELKENQKALKFLNDEYILKYFLGFETKEDPHLLNIEKLKNPFAYKLKVNLKEVGEPEERLVDLPETFIYLLGLKIKKIKVRNISRKYLFMLGEKDSKDIAIVWREYDENWVKEEFTKDKKFIIEELEPWAPQIVYINGQCVLTCQLGKHPVEIRYIDPEFKKLMER